MGAALRVLYRFRGRVDCILAGKSLGASARDARLENSRFGRLTRESGSKYIMGGAIPNQWLQTQET